jgi:hypothetical protein
VSDYRRHSVYHGRVINTTLGLGGKERHTLGIKKDGVVPEVWPLKHTLQFRDVFLSVRSHCVGFIVSAPRFHPPSPPTPTLLVIANEDHLPQRRLELGQYR